LRSAIRRGSCPSGSGADFADDATAALANAAGATAADAGLLDDRGSAIVVHRKAFSEIHLNILCSCPIAKADTIDAALSARREIA
jgi:hypothetical protein